MNEYLILALAWLSGLALGGIFFGGLWWTVRKGLSSQHPALLFFGSMALRMGFALAGFYFIGHGNWQRLLLCLLGFVMARLVVTRLTRPKEECQNRSPQEASHAP